MGNYLVEIEELSKYYKDGGTKTIALDKVSFNIKEGESVAIVGPSGSGKTTLLEIMAGLNKPSSGKVLISGRNVHKGSDKETSRFRNKTIGFVFQMMHLQDYFTAQENVMIPLVAGGISNKVASKKAIDLLTQVGLEKKVRSYPKKLSGGEMQRVAVARALANDPRIIFADEPTGKLDRANADKVMDILMDIAGSGVSIIMITHDERLAQRFKRNIHLDHGKLVKG